MMDEMIEIREFKCQLYQRAELEKALRELI